MLGTRVAKPLLIVSFSVASLTGIAQGLTTAHHQTARPAAERTYGRFEGAVLHGCYDGDTCTFTIPGVHPLLGDHIGVRLRGIDTPEIRGKCEREKALAQRARKRLEELLRAAKRVDLTNVAREKYFRILATVKADGIDTSALLLREGLARDYEGGTKEAWCGPVAPPSGIRPGGTP